MAFAVLCAVTLLIRARVIGSTPAPSFPLQFSANLEITAHLISPDSEYPPRVRRMSIYYDYVNKLARAELESGYEAAKVYIRRYDQNNEYMVRLPPIHDCKRSYLGEVMPFPDIPEADFVGEEVLSDTGIRVNHFVHDDFETRIHVYMSASDGSPVRLIQESVDEEDEISSAILTYDYSDVVLGAPDSSWFELPDEFDHKSCVRHIGGFPYLHVFHYFVRF